MIELVTAKSDSEALQVNAVLEKHQQSHQTSFNDFNISLCENSEVVIQRCSVKKVFIKISQNSQENTCRRVSF